MGEAPGVVRGPRPPGGIGGGEREERDGDIGDEFWGVRGRGDGVRRVGAREPADEEDVRGASEAGGDAGGCGGGEGDPVGPRGEKDSVEHAGFGGIGGGGGEDFVGRYRGGRRTVT